MLLGRTGERAPLVPRGLLTDGGVKAGGGTRYRIRLADLFGRFGDAAEIDAPDPERPLPPAPALQVEVVLDGPEGDEPGRVSPGRVVVRVPVPPIRDVATGSLPIAGAQLTLDGRSEVVSVAPGDPAGTVMLEHTFDLPELGQGETGESTLRATLIDGADRDGPSAETTVRFNDRRRPPTVVTGRGLIWTSRPGPSPEVELRLSWPAAANTRYRAYVADATSLGLTGVTRADVAHAGTERDAGAGLGTRDHFRLLSDEPMSADGGRVTMTELFPRSLHSVQFLRIVPVSDLGREAEFERCRVIPVAVPTDRRPPAPRVRATVDRDGSGATIAIEAVGLDLKALADAEPGLFEDPPVPTPRPRSSASDEQWARSVNRCTRRGGPGRVGAGGHRCRTGLHSDLRGPGPLPPYVRVSYWAEMRMPAERRLLANSRGRAAARGGGDPGGPGPGGADAGALQPGIGAIHHDRAAGNQGTHASGADATVSADAGTVAMTLAATASPVATRSRRAASRCGCGNDGDRATSSRRSGRGAGRRTVRVGPGSRDRTRATNPQRWCIRRRARWPVRTAARAARPTRGLGGPRRAVHSGPAVCSHPAQQLSVLGVYLDGLPRSGVSTGSVGRWTGPQSPGRSHVAGLEPSAHDGTGWLATSRGECPILFRRVDGEWTAQAAGSITSAKAMVALDNGKVRQFGVFSTGVHESTWNGAAWSAGQRLPGPDVGPRCRGAGDGIEVDLVIRARDGSVQHRHHANGAWGPWRRLGKFVASAGPAIGRLDQLELAVFARGQEGRLHWTRLRADGEAPGPASPACPWWALRR